MPRRRRVGLAIGACATAVPVAGLQCNDQVAFYASCSSRQSPADLEALASGGLESGLMCVATLAALEAAEAAGGTGDAATIEAAEACYARDEEAAGVALGLLWRCMSDAPSKRVGAVGGQSRRDNDQVLDPPRPTDPTLAAGKPATRPSPRTTLTRMSTRTPMSLAPTVGPARSASMPS